MKEEREAQHGVQSLEVGMSILRAMVKGHRSMMLKDIAAAAGMPPSKAHRYLVSLIRAGLVDQDPATSRYDLGGFALNIGMVAIDRLDRVRLGLTAIADLRDRINETTALAIWGDRGPVIVRWERPRRSITVNVVTGAQMNLLNSASGRVFAAWLPKTRTAPIVAEELKTLRLPEDLRTRAGVDAMLERVRTDGVAAISDGYFAQGVEALAAPVFNLRREITMALVVVGVRGTADFRLDGLVVTELKRAAAALSHRLGCPEDPGPEREGG
ncbi:MAG: IclR family transcriptional regulator [Burkholderiales bacterium]